MDEFKVLEINIPNTLELTRKLTRDIGLRHELQSIEKHEKRKYEQEMLNTLKISKTTLQD